MAFFPSHSLFSLPSCLSTGFHETCLLPIVNRLVPQMTHEYHTNCWLHLVRILEGRAILALKKFLDDCSVVLWNVAEYFLDTSELLLFKSMILSILFTIGTMTSEQACLTFARLSRNASVQAENRTCCLILSFLSKLLTLFYYVPTDISF